MPSDQPKASRLLLLIIMLLLGACTVNYDLPVHVAAASPEAVDRIESKVALLVPESTRNFRWVGSPDQRGDYTATIPLGEILDASLAQASGQIFSDRSIARVADQLHDEDVIIVPRLVEIGYTWQHPDRMWFPVTVNYLVIGRNQAVDTGPITSVATSGDGTYFATIVRSQRWQDELSSSISAAIQHTLFLAVRERQMGTLFSVRQNRVPWSAEQRALVAQAVGQYGLRPVVTRRNRPVEARSDDAFLRLGFGLIGAVQIGAGVRVNDQRAIAAGTRAVTYGLTGAPEALFSPTGPTTMDVAQDLLARLREREGAMGGGGAAASGQRIRRCEDNVPHFGTTVVSCRYVTAATCSSEPGGCASYRAQLTTCAADSSHVRYGRLVPLMGTMGWGCGYPVGTAVGN